MNCPIHEELLREEYTEEGLTAICLKCPKRYIFCKAQLYMKHCDQEVKHEGHHRTKDGTTFEASVP